MLHRIALVMIVRNEARCLARCLASAAPLVDEMLVLDTGSTDDTPAIARQGGARVAHFPWIDDFSVARNQALSLVDTPWRLVLDADEWIAGGADCLIGLRTELPNFLGLVTVNSLVSGERGEQGGQARLGEAPSWLPRVLPQGACYQGSIHEQPVSPWPRRRLDLVIGHDGYLPAHSAAKRGRNRRLLTTALAAAPGDAYLAYQLGKDFEVHAEHDQALPHYEAAHRLGDAQAAWRHDLVVRLMFTLKKTGRFEAALALADDEMARFERSPDFFFTLGDVLLDGALARPARAAEWLPLIQQAWLRAIEIGERPDLPDSLRGRGSYLAAHNLAAYHTSLGQADQAALWQQRAAAWRTAAGA